MVHAAMAQSPPDSAPPVPAPPVVAPFEARVALPVAEEASDFYIRLTDGAVGGHGDEERPALPVSDYWIGVALGELPDVAKQQLGL
jgi:hypothetical protein